jgi:hypothetical protein
MKLPIQNFKFRIPIEKKSAKPAAARCAGTTGNSQFAIRNSQFAHGFALIITLILLSVTLIMAVAFLAISRRERGSVVTSTDTATARYAADAALANAEAQIISSALAATNPYINNLLVSTNFINASGFDPANGQPYVNVNFDHTLANAPLTPAQFLTVITNLWYLPRVPVFVPTNALGASDFRFYLDLNRNGSFEDSGMVTNVDNKGAGFGTANFQTGDPQWIGVLERPDAPHGPNNKFLARYAFIALPADGALDINAIHNEAMTQTANPLANGQDGYFRNQGAGSWEINLAAFLTDLNPNVWDTVAAPYNYQEALAAPFPNTGFAFQDALSLVSYRYGFYYNSLAPVGGPGGPVLPGLFTSLTTFFPFQNNIDYYSRGGLMTTLGGTNFFPSITVPWAGADNTNHYFALMSDLFDPAKVEYNVVAPGFIERLNQAGTNTYGGTTVPTYDRYTFYRLLSQLGTDSSPDDGKMNLNYDNLDPFVPGINGPVYDTNGVVSLTNFAAWTPLAFFTNAADRMLRLYTTNWFQNDPSNYLATYYGLHFSYTNIYTDSLGNVVITTNDPSGAGLTNALGLPNVLGLTRDGVPAFGLTNIPVSINGQFVYASAVQRVLQLAANIYDASTNSFYPSRFRPVFTRMKVATSATTSTTNVYVSGYTNQITSVFHGSEFLTPDLATPISPADFASSTFYNFNQPYLLNIYGVPWIIGAKKGFPNFNEFSMENSIRVTRKLQVSRNTTTVPASNYTTNQMYSMVISNYYGLECWNSYFNKTNYTGPTGQSGQVVIMVRNLASMTLTNEIQYAPHQAAFPLYPQTVFTTNYLTYTLNSWPSNLFVVPLNTNASFFNYTNPVYVYQYNQFGSTSNFLDSPVIYPLPQFGFRVTNYLQVAIIDYSENPRLGQVVDYVELGPLTGSPRDLNREIADVNITGFWSTNLGTGLSGLLPWGVINQVTYSKNGGTIPDSEDLGSEGKWSQVQVPGLPPGINTSPEAEQLFFRAFFSTKNTANYVGPLGNYTVTNLLSQMQAPYTPTRSRVQRLTWQANDPLVHYLASDLNDLADDTNAQFVVDWPYNLGVLNNRYQPWGGNPNLPGNPATPDDPRTASDKNMGLKDPQVTSSAKWDFPNDQFPTVGWLGRVHRGSPWQTVYLKASNVVRSGNGTNIWRNWTGDFNTADAMNEGPVQDRLLFDIFSTAINDNASRGRLSVNVAASTNDLSAGLAAWSAVFSGVAVPTNTLGGYTIIQPAGAAGINSLLGDLVTNINYQRTFFTNATSPVGAFKHVGDILSVRALTEQSPFLATNTVWNDEMYEWLPQQTLSLLRASTTPRYVIYCYGQALKPAPNGVVTSGGATYFGMVTNYQVVAETATRAVVQFHTVVVTNNAVTPNQVQTNYSATLEQFNPLPPD